MLFSLPSQSYSATQGPLLNMYMGTRFGAMHPTLHYLPEKHYGGLSIHACGAGSHSSDSEHAQ